MRVIIYMNVLSWEGLQQVNISGILGEIVLLLIIYYSMNTTNYECHATTPYGFSPLTGVTNFKHECLSNREELHGVTYTNRNISTSRIHREDPWLRIE